MHGSCQMLNTMPVAQAVQSLLMLSPPRILSVPTAQHVCGIVRTKQDATASWRWLQFAIRPTRDVQGPRLGLTPRTPALLGCNMRLTLWRVVAHEDVALGAADGAARKAAAQSLRARPHHLREMTCALAEPCTAADTSIRCEVDLSAHLKAC